MPEAEQKQKINMEMEKAMEEVKDPALKKVFAGILESIKHSDLIKK